MAAGFLKLGSASEHTIQFIYQHGDGLVAFVGANGGVHIRPVDRDMAFGGETVGDILLRITLKLNSQSNDALFVTEESDGFLLNKLL